MDEKAVSKIVKERVGDYVFDFDEKNVKCSAMRTVFTYMEHAYGEDYTKKLISILNQAVGKSYFSPEYFQNDMNWVSYEVYQTIFEIAKEITGDKKFCYHAGHNYFKLHRGGNITLGKYFGSPYELYKRVPHFIRKYNTQIILKVIEMHKNRATITMALKPRFRKRAAHRYFFFQNGCNLMKGVLQSIPVLFDFPPAEVVDVTCLGHGHKVCEWKFVWKKAPLYKRAWHSIVARDYKKLMREQNEELNYTITELERKYDELLEKNKEILSYQAQIIEKEKLESAVKLLSELAHDLKTPLTMISGYAQLFRTGTIPPEEIKEYSELILDQSNRTVSIVQDLLNYLRGSPPTLNKQIMSVQSFIEEFYSEISPSLQAKNIMTNLNIDNLANANFFIDRESLKRAVYNIAKNAKEAMPDGGELALSGALIDNDVVIKLADTGIGIPKDRQEEVFKRFASNKKNGTGLGMGIAKSIVEAHNGTIRLSSQVKKGTEIIITMPVHKS
jgi:signal transduction histidine kinase